MCETWVDLRRGEGERQEAGIEREDRVLPAQRFDAVVMGRIALARIVPRGST